MSNRNVTAVSARVAARLPLDLVAWIDAQPGTRTEVIERAIEAMRRAMPKVNQASEDKAA